MIFGLDKLIFLNPSKILNTAICRGNHLVALRIDGSCIGFEFTRKKIVEAVAKSAANNIFFIKKNSSG